MVRYAVLLLHLMVWSLAFAGQAQATTTATVDRNPVMAGETFNLTVRSTDADAKQPDLSALESQFRVLNTVSGSEYRLVNGRASQTRHWTTTLVATRPGDYRIPPISVGPDTTDPIELQVVPAGNGNGPRDAFVEFEADQTDPYMREQVLLTVRLYVSGDLVSGQLGEPAADHAVIEQIGEQSESRAIRDGERYHLFERRYVLFPEQPGPLTIQPPRFTGELSTGRQRSSMFNLGQFAGQTRQIYAEAEPIPLSVKAPPAGWTGPWIPASDVELIQTLVPDTGPFVAGEPFSRVTELLIDGQLHTQIDPLRPLQPDGVQSYGDPPDATTEESTFGVQARIAQQWALIANRSGELEIPELRLRWWDTDDDTPRETVIPARRIQVEAGAAGQVTPPPAMEAPQPAPATPGDIAPPPADTSSWPWLSYLLAIGWAATILAWLWTARRRRSPSPDRPTPDRASRRDLLHALDANDPATARQAILSWGRQRHAPHPVVSLSELARREGDPEFAEQLHALDAALFGEAREAWSAEALKACIRRLPEQAEAASRPDPLPPLYPLRPGHEPL
ncbi:BatD family protein [uncultured Abyssibacter sp.]|uniref:BatD family protein n=1 Tax=uncultured Abyssibacter sp. TaxID=2320202 RepID=UPI0032B0F2D0